MIILTSIVLPSVWGKCQIPVKNIIIDNTNQLNDDDFTWVKFCRRKVSGVYELKSGYTHYGYAFNAEDVICIISWEMPLFQHLNKSEELAIGIIHNFEGTISNNYINAYHRFLQPKFIWLIYCIISFVKTV
jgi:hypothetical protein